MYFFPGSAGNPWLRDAFNFYVLLVTFFETVFLVLLVSHDLGTLIKHGTMVL